MTKYRLSYVIVELGSSMLTKYKKNETQVPPCLIWPKVYIPSKYITAKKNVSDMTRCSPVRNASLQLAWVTNSDLISVHGLRLRMSLSL